MVEADLSAPRLRVKALQSSRRRAGLVFGREAVDLSRADIGDGLEGVMRFAALLDDPMLYVTLVEGEGDDQTERAIDDDERAAITAYLEAEQLKVDPANPPTFDAAAASAEPAPEPEPAASPRKKRGTA